MGMGMRTRQSDVSYSTICVKLVRAPSSRYCKTLRQDVETRTSDLSLSVWPRSGSFREMYYCVGVVFL